MYSLLKVLFSVGQSEETHADTLVMSLGVQCLFKLGMFQFAYVKSTALSIVGAQSKYLKESVWTAMNGVQQSF